MKGYAKKNSFELIFLLLQTILYVAFLTLDITGGSIRLSVGIKYLIIILCFCYVLLKKGACKSIVFCLLRAGLFFTLISDLFILILDYYFYGVLAFILVQQLYSLRLIILRYKLIDKSDRSILYGKRVVTQVGIAALVCLGLWLTGITLEGLLVASVFYFISILFNTIGAIRLAHSNRKDRGILLYAVGMVLFLLCDINVGLFNLTGFITMPEEIYLVIYSFSSILMWTFYAPSQVLIALSCSYNHITKEQSK